MPWFYEETDIVEEEVMITEDTTFEALTEKH
jgi:hypothetical protein